MTSAALDRFKEAQDAPSGGFDAALEELKSGRKRSHWIWYVFPQLSGLGSSEAARFFGIDGLVEARQYIADPLLRRRLLAAVEAVADQVRTNAVPLRTLMGSEIDAVKLVSSLTLFEHAANAATPAAAEAECQALSTLCTALLGIAAVQGYPRCPFTLERISQRG
jgi:uncharacterized protein (DUF1810 family)